MFNWFDLMRQAQASAGFDTLMRQFQLSEEQSQKAMLAFMPAFVLGMQRAMLAAPSNPFFQNLAGSAYQNLWHPAGGAFSPQAYRHGEQVLDQIFGSDEASRRIAHQAADFTGLNVSLMQQILPLLAGIFAGSMHQWMTHQGSLPEVPRPQQAPAPTASDPWTAFWTGWAQTAGSGDGPRRSGPDGTAKPRATPHSSEKAEKAKKPEKPSALPWQEMMETGQEMQMQYLRSLQSILSDAWRPGEERR